jgi:TPR repeat protein
MKRSGCYLMRLSAILAVFCASTCAGRAQAGVHDANPKLVPGSSGYQLRFSVAHQHAVLASLCEGYLYFSKEGIRYEVVRPDKHKDHAFQYHWTDLANAHIWDAKHVFGLATLKVAHLAELKFHDGRKYDFWRATEQDVEQKIDRNQFTWDNAIDASGIVQAAARPEELTKLLDDWNAAERGDPTAEFKLGMAYAKGGTPLDKDDAEACKWLQRSAEQGYQIAFSELISRDAAGSASAHEALSNVYERGVTFRDAKFEKQLGAAAEQQGHLREAFEHYVLALNKLPITSTYKGDSEIREAVVRIAVQLDPKPVIPEDARRHAAFAMTALQLAEKDPVQLDKAVQEWREAIRMAPWWPEGNFNLGLLLEKHDQYVEAASYLRLYLLASPNATDRDAVQQRIYSLEYRAKQ